MDIEDAFFGVNRPGRGDDHSRPSSAEAKNYWCHKPFFLHAFMACARVTFIGAVPGCDQQGYADLVQRNVGLRCINY